MWRLGSWIAWVLTWSASAPRSLDSLRTVSSPNRDYRQSSLPFSHGRHSVRGACSYMKRTCTSHVANAVVLPNLGRQSAYLYGFSINIRFVLGRLTLTARSTAVATQIS